MYHVGCLTNQYTQAILFNWFHPLADSGEVILHPNRDRAVDPDDAQISCFFSAAVIISTLSCVYQKMVCLQP